jgi:uncharacterized protein with von Willebrand factor type A (vWA) domain
VAEPVDLPALAVGLGRALHAAGVPVTTGRSLGFAQALELMPPVDRDSLYWTARATLVSSREQIDVFDRVFGAVFDGLVDPADSRSQAGQGAPARSRSDERRGSAQPSEALDPLAAHRPFAAAAAMAASRGGEDAGRDALMAAASAEERLGEKSFDSMSPEELAELRRFMRRLAVAAPERRTRRQRRGRRGERIDLRATLRMSLRTGGDPVDLARRRRRVRRRPLVMVLDISGSMEPYARAFLQFLETGVGGASAEAFVFATRLTRLTRALRGGAPQVAIERAAAAAPDWSGGTRIGAALKELNDRYARRGLARGAVVVILSDGWERGDPQLVAREMERLSRLAYRIVWVNPRAAAPAFAPLAGGMAAALPWIDALVSGHNLSALDAVVDAIATDRREEMHDGLREHVHRQGTHRRGIRGAARP